MSLIIAIVSTIMVKIPISQEEKLKEVELSNPKLP